jgi:peptidoglycan/LPS O-acetylase OafA/YrhL
VAQTLERPVTEGRSSRAVVPKLQYQPGLDGLRAIAVVAVMLYHAQMNQPTSWMPGGFVGVEVFFVISGYLITLLLISEHLRTQRIDFKQFWLRRARRLLPALFALLVVTMGIVGIGGHYSESLREHVHPFRGTWASAWGYATNWYQIFAGLNYADKEGRPPLVRHLWSLAVEEQFYLLWPLIMAFVLWRWGRRLPKVGVAFIVVSLAITVGTALAYQPVDAPTEDLVKQHVNRDNFLYLSTITRASGLLLGAALAIFWRPWLMRSAGVRHWRARLDVLAFAGLGALVLMCATFHSGLGRSTPSPCSTAAASSWSAQRRCC